MLASVPQTFLCWVLTDQVQWICCETHWGDGRCHVGSGDRRFPWKTPWLLVLYNWPTPRITTTWRALVSQCVDYSYNCQSKDKYEIGYYMPFSHGANKCGTYVFGQVRAKAFVALFWILDILSCPSPDKCILLYEVGYYMPFSCGGHKCWATDYHERTVVLGQLRATAFVFVDPQNCWKRLQRQRRIIKS